MEETFWLEKWRIGQIGFHRDKVHARLAQFFDKFSLAKGESVFLPLCGKTLDIKWLLEKGVSVVGVELSSIAVEQLFEELGEKPDVFEQGKFKVYKGKMLKVYQGDFFNLKADDLTEVKAVYDRASMVALPPKIRMKYAKHILEITQQAPQLLITFHYDQSLMQGPPFAVLEEEVKEYYSEFYEITSLVSAKLEGGLKGQVVALEEVWWLSSY